MNSTYDFTLKEGSKGKMENFLVTKSRRKFLEGLKQKVDIFIGSKNIFNTIIKNMLIYKQQLKSFTFQQFRICF